MMNVSDKARQMLASAFHDVTIMLNNHNLGFLEAQACIASECQTFDNTFVEQLQHLQDTGMIESMTFNHLFELDLNTALDEQDEPRLVDTTTALTEIVNLMVDDGDEFDEEGQSNDLSEFLADLDEVNSLAVAEPYNISSFLNTPINESLFYKSWMDGNTNPYLTPRMEVNSPVLDDSNNTINLNEAFSRHYNTPASVLTKEELGFFNYMVVPLDTIKYLASTIDNEADDCDVSDNESDDCDVNSRYLPVVLDEADTNALDDEADEWDFRDNDASPPPRVEALRNSQSVTPIKRHTMTITA